MKKIILLFFIALFLFSCFGNKKNDVNFNVQEPAPLIIGGKHIDGLSIEEAGTLTHIKLDINPNDINKLNSLENIELLINLTGLVINVSNLNAIDLSPLASLTNLIGISINCGHLDSVDLNPLSSLINLKSFSVSGNNLNLFDFNPLATLKNLETLYIDGNITMLPNLTLLEKLTHIIIKNSALETLEGLGAPNLKRLEIQMETFDSLAPLSNLTELESLIITTRSSGNRTSIGNIKNVTKLKSLTLRIGGEFDLSGIENLTNIIELRLDGTRTLLINPNAISKLQNLEVFVLFLNEENPSIEFLQNFNKLEFLYIVSSFLFNSPPAFPVLDVSPLRNNRNLFYLDIRGFVVKKISSLDNLTFEDDSIRLFDSRLFNENDVSVHYLEFVPRNME